MTAPWHLTAAEMDAAWDDLAAENAALRDVLLRGGFVQCDIAACNCGSWHQRYGWPERFHEIDAATEDEARNGETLLARVQRIIAEVATFKARLAKVERLLQEVYDGRQSLMSVGLVYRIGHTLNHRPADSADDSHG